MQARLLAAGFTPGDAQLLIPADHPRAGNVVARLHGAGMESRLCTYVTSMSSPPIRKTGRATCTATQIEGGDAQNALLQRARATLQCRIIPGVAAFGQEVDFTYQLMRAFAGAK